MRFNDSENLLLIKFKKTEGTQDEFKNISSKILKTIKGLC